MHNKIYAIPIEIMQGTGEEVRHSGFDATMAHVCHTSSVLRGPLPICLGVHVALLLCPCGLQALGTGHLQQHWAPDAQGAAEFLRVRLLCMCQGACVRACTRGNVPWRACPEA